jgi:hypothetical protein
MRPRDRLRLLAGLLLTLFAIPGAMAEAPLVPLIKLEYPGNPPNIRMLYVRVLALGGRAVDAPLLFDTGSAGVTIACEAALPPAYCSTGGIDIQEPLELDGLTVTPKRIVAQYGTYDEYGNLAFARIRFGSDGHSVTTTEIVPLLIRYKRVRRATGEIVGGPLWPKGIFGVSPVGTQAGGALRSPIEAIAVPAGWHRGYRLSPIGAAWRACTNEQGTCPEVAALYLGVDEAARKSFTLAKLGKVKSDHYHPFVEACVAWQDQSICRPAIYDTGNSTIMVAGKAPVGVGPSLAIGTDVSITGPDERSWRFTTLYQPEVEFAPHMDTHLIGIRYFETNSLLVDLDTQEVGLRLGW